MPIPDGLSEDPYAILLPADRWQPDPSDPNAPASAWSAKPPLVDAVRIAVWKWRTESYAGASPTTQALLQKWFPQAGGESTGPALRYYFAQQEAVESVIYLHEVARVRSKHDLHPFAADTLEADDLPEEWLRFAIKMATGSGKTKAISLLMAWSYFNKLYESASDLSRNFLLIAPNIIVLDRLWKDFDGLRIFHEDGVLPFDGYEGRDWQSDFRLRCHRQDDVRAHLSTGNIFLTNIHRVLDPAAREASATDDDASDYFLGPRPRGRTNADKTDLGEIVRDMDELLIINDEAHHIHDKRLAWFRAIQDLNNRLVQKERKLSMQLDFTATPKHENGAIFQQTVVDYPLVEAIHQNIVKRPVVPDDSSANLLRERETSDYVKRYEDYIRLGITEWRKARDMHLKAGKETGKKAILFVMTDDTKNCDAVAERLSLEHDLQGKVLVIHTNQSGDISEKAVGRSAKELDALRFHARTIDELDNPYEAVVSVLVLREGWDVRNVTTIVGLRKYGTPSKILPEQTLGRGLRLMYDLGRGGEKVSVIGSKAFAEFVREIEQEGVPLETAPMGEDAPAVAPLIVCIDRENPAKDLDSLSIDLPVLTRRYTADFTRLGNLSIADFNSARIPWFGDMHAQDRVIIFRDVLTDEESHRTGLADTEVRNWREAIAFLAHSIMDKCRLVSGYDILYPLVQEFARKRLFDVEFDIDLEKEITLRNLARPDAIETVVAAFKSAIGRLIYAMDLEPALQRMLKVTEMITFPCKHQEHRTPRNSPQNVIIGDSRLELDFCDFLETCPDVAAFAKNYFPQVGFALDYVRTDGAIARYYPDFLVRDTEGELWIIETKGRMMENDDRKFERLQQWCADVASLGNIGNPKCALVLEEKFRRYPPHRLADLRSLGATAAQ